MAFFRDSFSLGKKASSSSSSVFDLLTIKWEIWSFKECSDSTAAETQREKEKGNESVPEGADTVFAD